MLRKVFGIILAMTLVITFAGTVSASPLSDPYFGAGQKVQNGSFETIEGNVPASWTAESWKGLLGEEDGNRYLTPMVEDAGVQQLVTGLASYTVYECTFKMKSSIDNTPLIALAYQHYESGTATPIDEYYTANEISTADFTQVYEKARNYSFTYPAVGAEWKDMRFTFIMPTGANATTIRFGCRKDDPELAFDDIAVRKTNTVMTNGDFEMPQPVYVSGEVYKRVPFTWYNGGIDAFAKDGIGYNESVGCYISGNSNKVVSMSFPAIAGQTYILSYRYKIEFADKSNMTEEQIAASLSATGVRGMLDYPTAKTIAGVNASSEGEWYEANAEFTVEASEGDDILPLGLQIRRNGDTNANVLIYFDDVKIAFATDVVTYYAGDAVTTTLPAAGQTLKAACTHYTQGTADGTAMLILCVFEEENGVKRLVGFAMSDPKTITGGATLTASNFSVSMTMPDLEADANYYAETYVWETIGGLTPLAEKAILPQAAA